VNTNAAKGDTLIDEYVDRLNQEGPAWLWFANHVRNGDLYHICSLAAAFKKQHGEHIPIHLIVGSGALAAVAELFGEYFASIRVDPVFHPTAADWLDYWVRNGLPDFGPGVPIVLHPTLNPRMFGLAHFYNGHRVAWMQLYKELLNLPADVEPVAPARSADRDARARALCAENGIVPGRSVLLFPYAQSFPVPATPHFTAFTQQASDSGWSVFTSVAGAEAPIVGAPGVFIPFALLPEVAEQAGWVVAVRSGICDIVSTVRCRKTFLFRRKGELPVWGVDALELARDAHQLVLDVNIETPAAFCAQAFCNDGEAKLPSRVRSLSEALTTTRGRVVTTDFVDIQRGAPAKPSPARPWRFRAEENLLRLINLPNRAHARLSELARTAVADLIASAGPNARFYTCRDGQLDDFFEETPADLLEAGRYCAAGFWHTIVATPGGVIERYLPNLLQEKVLALEPLTPDRTVVIGESFLSLDHRAAVDGDRPLVVQGLQFLDGWSDQEPWGMWSSGETSVLKFVLDAAPTAAVVLELIGHFATTNRGPLTIETFLNGRSVQRRAIAAEEPPLGLEIVLPPDLMQNRVCWVELVFSGACSPKDVGISPDVRRLGLGLTTVRLKPVSDLTELA
jgi:hypothetical protein